MRRRPSCSVPVAVLAFAGLAAVLAVGSTSLLVGSAWAQRARPAATPYRLEAGSAFEEGCFAPCMCPILLGAGLQGGFLLEPRSVSGGRTVFAVTGLKWKVLLYGGTWRKVTGSGEYEIDVAARQQRMVLDLVVGDRPVERYDSGLVPLEVEPPRIQTALSLHGKFCYDIVFIVDAAPRDGEDLLPLPYLDVQPDGRGARNAGSGDVTPPRASMRWGTLKGRYP